MSGLTNGGIPFSGSLDGDLTFNNGTGKITTTANGLLKLVPDGVGYVVVGTGVSSHGFNSPNDLLVSGRLEVNSITYFDGAVQFASNPTVNAGILFSMQNAVSFLYGADDGCRVAVNDTNNLGNNHLIITALTNYNKNHDHNTLAPDPQLILHSRTDPDTSNQQFGTLDFDTANFRVRANMGGVEISAPSAAPTLGTNGSVSFYLDESGNNLKVAVKYSEGTTKTGTVALL
jgi:hypothetical protein